MTPDHTSATPDHDSPTTAPDSPKRRAALEKLAVLSAWTAPTTLMLLRSQRASAESPQAFNDLPPGAPGTEGAISPFDESPPSGPGPEGP